MKPLSVSAKMYIEGMIDWEEFREREKWTKKKTKSVKKRV